MAKKKKKAAEEEEEKKGGKGKMIAVGLVGLAAVYKFVLAPAPAEEAEGVDEQAERVIEEGDIFPMEELVVNLTDQDESRYLRVGLALVLEAGTSPDAMELEAPIAIDTAIDYLSGQSFDDLREPGSKTEIKAELSELIRAAYDDEKVVRVLLTTFVMQ